MKRREFFKRVGGGAVATTLVLTHQPRIVSRDWTRSYRCHEWRGYLWWIDDRSYLCWKRPDEVHDELDFISLAWPYDRFRAVAAPVDDKLWLVTERGWATFQFDARPTGDTARLTFVKMGL